MDPPDNAWDLLNSALDKKMALENKGGFTARKAIVIGISLLLISVVTYFIVLPNKNPESTSNNLSKEMPVVKNADNNASIEDKKKTEESNNDLTNPANQNSTSVSSATTDKTKSTLTKISDRNSNSSVVKSESENKVVHQQGEKKTKNESVNPENKKLNAVSDKQLIITEEKINPSTENISDVEKVVGSDILVSIENNTTNNSQSVTVVTENSISDKIDEDTLTKETIITDENKNIAITNSDTALNNIPLNKKNKNNLSIAVFYSPDFTKNRLTPNSSGGSEPVIEYYDHEKVKYAFSTGIKLQYGLTKHFGFTTGLTYSTLSYSSDLTTIYADYDDQNQINYLYTTSCGNIQIPNDNVTPLQKGDSLKLNTTCLLSVKFISIPFTVNYQLTKNRFSFYGYSGIAANFLMQAKARLQLNNADKTFFNEIDGVKKMNYGFLLGAGVRYRAFNHLGFFIEPSYRGSVNSLTQNISVNCYPFSLGVKTGLFYSF